MLQGLVKALMTKKGALLGTGLLGGGYLVGRSLIGSKDSEDTEPKDQPQQSAQPQSTQQTKPRKVAKSTPSQPQTAQTQNEQQNTPTVGVFLPELLKLYQLSNLLSYQYEQDAKAYYQVFQEYSERLEKLVPLIALGMAKTPLGMMTGLDLPEKIHNFLKYYSWDYVKQNFPKVLAGYYVLKANGHEDLTRFTIEDLIVASENPALAQATNQNMLNILSNIAENYKLVMQSALDQVGKLKDLYAYRLNTLKAQADMIGGIIETIMKEEKQNFEKYIKLREEERKEEELAWKKRYQSALLGLKQQQIKQKNPQNLIPINIQSSKEKGK
jgi:hypothetical protein